ncbi:hypothetical protein [Halorussus caseinilyticus]|uniref:Small CPxCG-related zinc finger protein n=1 Tax=Halorussus caseinilyticus TaxID=3034025 RepID=A0ABD5WTL4_9EURY|nr:hypothetical protein [Halorussus sp. DT72]
MGDFRRAVEDALSGPDAESIYECAHCGVGHDDWAEDCRRCGGVLTRIVTDDRDDDSPSVP